MSKIDPNIFRRAASVMRERGKCTGDYEGADGAVCMVAALAHAHGYKGYFAVENQPSYQCLLQFIQQTIGYTRVSEYSDDNTLDACCATFEECAQHVELVARVIPLTGGAQ